MVDVTGEATSVLPCSHVSSLDSGWNLDPDQNRRVNPAFCLLIMTLELFTKLFESYDVQKLKGNQKASESRRAFQSSTGVSDEG